MYQDWMKNMPIIISSENKGNKNKSIEKLQKECDDLKSKIENKIEELRKLNEKQTDKEVNKMRDYAIEVLSELF